MVRAKNNDPSIPFFSTLAKTLGVEVAVVFDDFFGRKQCCISLISGLPINIVLPDFLGFNYQRVAVVSTILSTNLSDLF